MRIHVFESTHTCLVADNFVFFCFMSSGVCLLDCQVEIVRIDAIEFNCDLLVAPIQRLWSVDLWSFGSSH